MKVLNVLNLNTIIKNIIDDTSLKVDPLVKFKLLGILKQIEPCVSNFEIIRNEKIKEYGTEQIDEDGNSTGNLYIPQDDKESVEKYTKDLNKLLNTNADVDLKKFKAHEIFDKNLSADFLLHLYDLIEQ